MVYGEIDFWYFYDIIKVAVDGMETKQHQDRRRGNIQPRGAQSAVENDDHPRPRQSSVHEGEEAEGRTPVRPAEGKDKEEEGRRGQVQGDDEAVEEGPDCGQKGPVGDKCIPVSGDHVNGSDKTANGALASRRAVEAEATAMAGGVEGGGLKFYDLGSGSGRAVFAAVLVVDFR